MVDFSCFSEMHKNCRFCRFSRNFGQICTLHVFRKFTRENLIFLTKFQLLKIFMCNIKFTRENIDFVHKFPTPPKFGISGGVSGTLSGKIPEHSGKLEEIFTFEARLPSQIRQKSTFFDFAKNMKNTLCATSFSHAKTLILHPKNSPIFTE